MGRLCCLCRNSILEIFLPGFEADYLSAALPILQTSDRDAHLPSEWLLPQAEGLSVVLNLPGLSVAQEAVIAVQQIIYGNTKERCKLVRNSFVKAIQNTGL